MNNNEIKFIEECSLELKPRYSKGIFEQVLSVNELETLINFSGWQTTRNVLPTYALENDLSWDQSRWASIPEQPPIEVMQSLIKDGVVWLKDTSRISERVNDVAKTIEQFFNMPTDHHVYFNNDKFQNPFGIHKDAQHNFIIQGDGVTKWKIGSIQHDPYAPDNLDKFDEEVIVDIDLYPGDVIFVPAHYYHQPINYGKRYSSSFCVASNGSTKLPNREWIKW